MEGDFYVDEDERLRERISDLYYEVSNYPGVPSRSQLERTQSLAADMEVLENQFEEITVSELDELNNALVKRDIVPVSYMSFAAFLESDAIGSGNDGGGFGEGRAGNRLPAMLQWMQHILGAL